MSVLAIRAAFWITAIGLLPVLTTPAECAILRYNFTGTIQTAFDTDAATNPDSVFGAQVGIGDSVTGFFSYDTEAAVQSTTNGLTGQATSYHQNTPYQMSVILDGIEFTNDGVFDTTVVNDFTSMVGEVPLDFFALGDGIEVLAQGGPGTTILVDGVQTTAQFSLEFEDNEATVFNSTMLPLMPDLAEFERVEGRISGFRTGSVFQQTTFSVDSIQLASVPEPGTSAVCGLLALGLWIRRRWGRCPT